jgi:hypothetical protein
VSNVHTICCRLKYCLSTSASCESNLAVLNFRQITDLKQDLLNPWRRERQHKCYKINRNLPFTFTGIKIFHIFKCKPGIKLITKGSSVILKQEKSLMKKRRDQTRKLNPTKVLKYVIPSSKLRQEFTEL